MAGSLLSSPPASESHSSVSQKLKLKIKVCCKRPLKLLLPKLLKRSKVLVKRG